MWPDLQETVKLVTFTEEILNEKLHFLCSAKDVESYSAQWFIKILRTFFNEEQINIHANATKKTVVWKVGPMTFENATELAKAGTQSDFLSIWQCANTSIKHILPLEQKPSEEPLTVENIIEGEVKIPESLKEFYKILYTGNANKQYSAKKSYVAGGSSVDAIFVCSRGKIIPAKHLSLGLTKKSLRESKAIAFLLNLFGHCASD